MAQVEWQLRAGRFVELAKTALQEGLSEELVVKITGLSGETVRRLKDELDEQARGISDRRDAGTAGHGTDD